MSGSSNRVPRRRVFKLFANSRVVGDNRYVYNIIEKTRDTNERTLFSAPLCVVHEPFRHWCPVMFFRRQTRANARWKIILRARSVTRQVPSTVCRSVVS